MRRIAVVAASLLVSGCYSLQGPPQVINQGGILPSQPTSSGQTADLIQNFERAAIDAYPYRTTNTVGGRESTGRTIDETQGRRTAHEKQKIFLRAGFTLVYARCNDYFWMMGQRQ